MKRDLSKHEVVVRVPEVISPAVIKTRKQSLNDYHFLGGSSSTEMLSLETGQGGTSTLHEKRKSAEHSDNLSTDEPNMVGWSQRISESVSNKEKWHPGGQNQT